MTEPGYDQTPPHPKGVTMHQQPYGQQARPGQLIAPVVPLRRGQALAPVDVIEGEVVTEKRPGDELVVAARAAGVVTRWSWRHRWALSPVAAGIVTMGAAGAGNGAEAAALWTSITAGVAWWAARGPQQIAGRTWLSRRERRIGASYAGGAAAWSSLAALGAIAPSTGAGWATLAAATGVQGAMWAASRMTGPREEVQEQDVEDTNPDMAPLINYLLTAWPTWALGGPRVLEDTQVSTLSVPRPGTITGRIELPATTHPAQFARQSQAVIEFIEGQLGLGTGIVVLRRDKDDATSVTMTISPTRELQKCHVTWEGPDLDAKGFVTLATTDDGEKIRIPLWGRTGSRHFFIAGGTGMGKSSLAPLLIIPAALSGHAVMWHIDGKEGASLPHLARCFNWVTKGRKGWGDMIRAAHAVMCARKARYSRFGFATYQHQHDPLLIIVMEEAHKIATSLNAAELKLLVEIGAQGRQLGVAVWVSTQSVNAADIPGDMPMRNNLMANGTSIGLKPGGKVASQIMTTNAGENIDLTELPGGGGWCAVLHEGDTISTRCRTYYIDVDDPEVVETVLNPQLEKIEAVGLAELCPDDVRAAEEAVPKAWPVRETGAQWHHDQQEARALLATLSDHVGNDPIIDENGRWQHMPLPDVTAIKLADAATPAPVAVTPAQPTPAVAPVAEPPALRLVSKAAPAVAADDEDDDLLYAVSSVPAESAAAPVARGAVARRTKLAEAQRLRLLSLFEANGSLRKADIQREMGLSEASARRRLHDLRDEGVIQCDDSYRWSIVAAEASA